MSNDPKLTRRDLLATAAYGAAVLSVSAITAARAETAASIAPAAPATALAGKNEMVPLPFNPASLHGLSQRMISSHYDNNYGGAVKNLNRVEQELAKINADTPPFEVAALREKELTFRNSKSLHEAYFANLGGNGQRSGRIEGAIAAAYGSAGRWEEHFRATATGLGGGSGWVVLAYELDSGGLRTIAAANHAQSLAVSLPLFVLDMYEHAYQMDFGAAAAKYIDAFFQNANWDEVNRRLEVADKAAAVVRAKM